MSNKNRSEQPSILVPPISEEAKSNPFIGLEEAMEKAKAYEAGAMVAGVDLALSNIPQTAGESYPTKIEVPTPAELDAKFMLAQVAAMIDDAKAELRAEWAKENASPVDGVKAQLIGGTFECPECGLRILGPGNTGQRGDLYEHPYEESQKLGGKQCELKGAKFRPPIVFLERVIKPLTGKKQ